MDEQLSATALLVIDMQNRFAKCTRQGAVTNHCIALIDWFHQAELPVFLTQHCDRDPQSVLYKWWNNPIQFGSFDWELLPGIKATADERDILIQDKTTYDAFMGTGLESKLRALQIKSLVICGCMTNLCCETTARAGFCRNFNILFPKDANGTDDHEMQMRTVENLSYGFATVCDTQMLTRFRTKELIKR